MVSKMKKINLFQRLLSFWVLICMIIGVIIGHYMPSVGAFFNKLQGANVNIPIAILIWLMIYPMMLKIDFTSIKKLEESRKN